MADQPKNIRIYFHICTLGAWQRVVKRLYSKILDTGLINKIDKIYVTVLGAHLQAVKDILKHPKVEIAFYSPNTKLYERKCLGLLREHSEKQQFKALYIHSKGITKKTWQANVDDWIGLMMYYTIEKHNDCIAALNNVDACGVNLFKASSQVLHYSASNKNPNQSYHFSGNFWWARSSYICKLPRTIGPKYLDPELWIGKGHGRLMSFWNSGITHYYKPYPRILYAGKQARKIVHV